MAAGELGILLRWWGGGDASQGEVVGDFRASGGHNMPIASVCQLQEQPADGRSHNRCGGDKRRRSRPVAQVQEPTCYGSDDEPQRDREDDEEHDPCSQLMLASRIEGHSREHRKGRGDDSAHAARDGEDDKDDAVVELGLGNRIYITPLDGELPPPGREVSA
jgi:hypothetical protein